METQKKNVEPTAVTLTYSHAVKCKLLWRSSLSLHKYTTVNVTISQHYNYLTRLLWALPN